MSDFPKTRDPLAWPFAASSIWNMPIGADAVFVPANIQPATAAGMTVDEDILILKPDAPVTDVVYNSAGWSKTKDRCVPEGDVLFQAPIPEDFLIPDDRPHTPNLSAAILLADGRTLKQPQPLQRCAADGPATALVVYPEVDLYGDGIEGAHGGSGLSSIGGTLRLGELVPDGIIRHALKINLFGVKNFYYAEDEADGKPGYRWPAVKADGYAGNLESNIHYQGENSVLQMGSLLALPPDIDLDANALELHTEPAKILAKAFQDYGAYIVDDTAWDVYAIATEWSPDGRVVDEFHKAWGFDFSTGNTLSPWAQDMKNIFTALHVVDNNGPDSIGGGGEPRMPLAPPLE